MHEQEAKQLLEQRVKNGGVVRSAITAELPAVKDLQSRCLERGIPAILGPCPGGS